MTRKDLITKCEELKDKNATDKYKNICTPDSHEKCELPCGGNLEEDECNDNIFCKYENGKCRQKYTNDFGAKENNDCNKFRYRNCEVTDGPDTKCEEKLWTSGVNIGVFFWIFFIDVIVIFLFAHANFSPKGFVNAISTDKSKIGIILGLTFIIPGIICIYQTIRDEIRFNYVEAISDFILIPCIYVIATSTPAAAHPLVIKITFITCVILSWLWKKNIYYGGPWNARTPYYNSFHPLIIFKVSKDSILDIEDSDPNDTDDMCLLPTVPDSDSDIPQIINVGDTYQIKCNDTFNGGGVFTCLNKDRHTSKFPGKDWGSDTTNHKNRLFNENGTALTFNNTVDPDPETCITEFRQHKCSAVKDDPEDPEICKKGDECSTIKDTHTCIDHGCNSREINNPDGTSTGDYVCENPSETLIEDICTEDSKFPHITDSIGTGVFAFFIHLVIILFFWKIIIPKSRDNDWWKIFSLIGQPIIFFLILITSSHLFSSLILDGSACPDKIEGCKAVKNASISNCGAIDKLCTYDGTNCVPNCNANPFAVLSEVLLGNNKNWTAWLIPKKILTIITTIVPWILIAFIIVRKKIKEKTMDGILVMLFVLILLIPPFVIVETFTSNISIKRLAITYTKTPSLWTCWLSAFGGWVPWLISWVIIIIMTLYKKKIKLI